MITNYSVVEIKLEAQPLHRRWIVTEMYITDDGTPMARLRALDAFSDVTEYVTTVRVDDLIEIDWETYFDKTLDKNSIG